MSVTLMICYARSGGTLLNRCLGCLPGVVILSEVNPGRKPGDGLHTVKEQAAAWYGIMLQAEDFTGGVLELESRCAGQGRHLVVRDWPVLDFVPVRQNGFRPRLALSAYEALKERCDLRAFVFVRDAIDAWISNGCRPDFFGHYRTYVERITEAGLPVFQYERFCERPSEVMRDICALGGIPYSEQFLEFGAFTRAHGDLQLGRRSRGGRAARIAVLPRRRLRRRDIVWVNACADMVRANELTGYPPDYHGRPRESWVRDALGRAHAWLRERAGAPA